MLGETLGALSDYLTGWGFDTGKEFLLDKKDEKAIREELRVFIESQAKYNEMCQLAEEVDFEAIMNYLSDNFMDDVKKRFFGDVKTRRKARDMIVEKAVSYSKADTAEAKKRVAKLVINATDILRNYYRETLGKGNLLLAAEVADDIIDAVEVSEEKMERSIKASEGNIVKEIRNAAPFSMDSYVKLASQNDIAAIESNLQKTLNVVSGCHPLYPHYIYRVENLRNQMNLVSVPTSQEAAKKYPPQFVCRGRIKVGDEYVDSFDASVVNYANRHQLAITLDIDEVTKLLGNIEDPQQAEARQMVGKKVVIQPTPFPPAFPCSIKLDGETVYEYIELRTKEILEDGTVLITNEEQSNVSLRIKIAVNIVSRTMNFSTRVENADNEELLKYVQFIKNVEEKAELSIYVLSMGKELMKGNAGKCDYKGGFASIDEEISLLQNVVTLEKYFQKTIKIADEIYENDVRGLKYLANLIQGESVETDWANHILTLPIIVGSDTKEKVAEMDEAPTSLSFVGEASTEIMGETYTFPIIRTYRSVAIQDLEKLKKKVDVLDEGETVMFKYAPGEDTTYVDVLSLNT